MNTNDEIENALVSIEELNKRLPCVDNVPTPVVGSYKRLILAFCTVELGARSQGGRVFSAAKHITFIDKGRDFHVYCFSFGAVNDPLLPISSY